MDYFPQKSPIISGSFSERDLQLEVHYAFASPCSRHESRLKGRISFTRFKGRISFTRLKGRISFTRLKGRISFTRLKGRFSFTRLKGRFSFTRLKGRISFTRVTRLFRKETCNLRYGVATISTLLKTIGLFCKRAL